MKHFFSLTVLIFAIVYSSFSQVIEEAPIYKMTLWDTSPYLSFRLKGGLNPLYDMPFRMLLPKNYDPSETSTTYPLLLMLHGAGESALGNARFGVYPNGDPRRYNNDDPLRHLGKEYLNAVKNGKWPGFVLFPQNKYGDWNDSNLSDAIEIIETLSKTYKIDPNRIVVAGLSSGANAVWAALAKHPTFFAGATPFSGISAPSKSNTTDIVHIPVWYFQGEVDTSPTKKTADGTIKAMQNIGATPVYTVIPETGHGTWAKAVAHADYFPFLTRVSKLKIHAYFGKTEFNNGEVVNVKLGITPGYSAYEWKKDEELLLTATSNEITATSLGSYSVRFKKGEAWTPWSEPCVLKLKTPPSITSHPISVTKTAGQLTTFQVAVSGTEPLSFQWQKGEVNIPNATSKTFTIPSTLKYNEGAYRVIVTNALGTVISNPATLKVNPALAASIDAPLSANLYSGGQTIYYSGNGNDSKGFDIPESNFSWRLELRTGTAISVIWTRTGSKFGEFVVPRTLETAHNSYYKIILTITDPTTLATRTIERNIMPKLSEVVISSSPGGLKFNLDGKPMVTTKIFNAVEGTIRNIEVISPQIINDKSYRFSHWTHGGTANQDIEVSINDQVYRAVFVLNTTAARLSSEEDSDLKETLSLYPNPCREQITLKMDAKKGEKLTIAVFNQLGKEIKSRDVIAEEDGENSITLNVENLESNSYILKGQSGNKIVYKHFIKAE